MPNNPARKFQVATAPSRFQKVWKNHTTTWPKFAERFAAPVESEEKDRGGYVAGYLRDGFRRKGAAETRSMLTLDIDYPTDDLDLMLDLALGGFAYVLHETHSSTPDAPRLRLIVPLAADLTAEEYVPAALKLMEQVGLDMFDPTTAQPERLMYWPARRSGSGYLARVEDGELLDAAALLAEYPDWRDSSCWPDVAHAYRTGEIQKAGDPREKPGLVGAFCRAYSVTEAIETFLADVYEEAPGGRWTFIGGHTVGGLAIYDDDTYAYSNHGTDPAEGRLLSAFDLVRVHKFGALDEGAKPDAPLSALPSQAAMLDLAREDKGTKLALDEGRTHAAVIDFQTREEIEVDLDEDDDAEDDRAWIGDLARDRNGRITADAGNIALILKHDPNLGGKIALDLFSNRRAVRGTLPWPRSAGAWSDADDSGLRAYFEQEWRIDSPRKIEDALAVATVTNAFHPVRDYLTPLVWDGAPRVDTLLIDYLGADDTPYVRAVTRKVLVAAVARVMRPGVKFDNMIVTTGPQGIGKSTLPARLAGAWFSDTLLDVHSKDAYDALAGVWIVEMGELSATKKADIDAVKHFLSKSKDTYRKAYARHTVEQERQCIFWGTSNEREFLRDRTGNRRFWPVSVSGESPLAPWDLTAEDIAQVWAEARTMFEAGEPLTLSAAETRLAEDVQAEHTETDALAGMLAEYLAVPVPKGWYEMGVSDRRAYVRDVLDNGADEALGEERTKVCVAEVWVELLDGKPGQIHPAKAAEIRAALDAMPGWSLSTADRSRARFGTGYGRQTAWLRD